MKNIFTIIPQKFTNASCLGGKIGDESEGGGKTVPPLDWKPFQTYANI